ncbi:MAG: hypothetical protein HYX22_01680 [Candidatus Yanofskybacteria bacterium]|nr:hypothetical protein [Candidatus Yanofskybacteria bacterium]
MARVGSEQNFAQFGGTFVLDNSRNDGAVLASYFGCEEAREEDERVFGRDPLRRFVPIEDVPAIGRLAGRRWANHARNARL